MIRRSSSSGRGYTSDVWRNLGCFRDPIRETAGLFPNPVARKRSRKGSKSPLGGPLERNVFTRSGFHWGLPVIFLLLATNLWATSWAFTSGLDWNSVPILALFAAFMATILTVQRRLTLATHPVPGGVR